MLSFQSLDVYQRSIDFLALTVVITEEIPRGHADMADQLRRAATSIPLNIGEAQGRTGKADKARCYAIARGSAMECAAVLDVCRTLKLVGENKYLEAIGLLERVTAMLTKMCL